MDKHIMDFEEGQNDANHTKEDILSFKRYVEFAEENGYGHPWWDYPLKPKYKARLFVLMFTVFWGFWILWNILRKICPN